MFVDGFEKRPPVNKAEKTIVVEDMQKADSITSAGANADSEQKAEVSTSSSNDTKPNVVGSQCHATEIERYHSNITAQDYFKPDMLGKLISILPHTPFDLVQPIYDYWSLFPERGNMAMKLISQPSQL